MVSIKYVKLNVGEKIKYNAIYLFIVEYNLTWMVRKSKKSIRFVGFLKKKSFITPYEI